MMTISRSLEELSAAFHIDNRISFSEKADGFIIASLSSPTAAASVAVHGGHVLTFTPHGQKPVFVA